MNARTVLWVLLFFGFWVNYMLRNNINIAIVAMVRENVKIEMKEKTHIPLDVAGFSSNKNETLSKVEEKIPYKNEFEWNEREQGIILGSYFFLHWLTQIPGGILSHHYGTVVVFGWSNFLCALSTIAIPYAANYGFNALVVLRVFQGLVSGAVWPSVSSMTAKWIPPKERSTFVSSYLGSSVGITFTYAVSGYIIDWYGWEYVFYLHAALGLLWSLAWYMLAYESPTVHPRISVTERNYILNSIGDSIREEKLPIPWKEILTSRGVWVNNILQFGTTWGLYSLITLSPTYLKFIHGLHITSTGVFAGIPHITRMMFAYFFGIITQHQTVISVPKIRKLATIFCSLGVGIIVFIISCFADNVVLSATLLVIAVTLQGTIPAGPMATLMDMSPNFSGILQGISGTISVLSGFIAPIIVGTLTEGNQTAAQWQKFFIITSVICCISGLLDLFFGTSKLQRWNDGAKKKIEESKSTQTKLLLTEEKLRGL